MNAHELKKTSSNQTLNSVPPTNINIFVNQGQVSHDSHLLFTQHTKAKEKAQEDVVMTRFLKHFQLISPTIEISYVI